MMLPTDKKTRAMLAVMFLFLTHPVPARSEAGAAQSLSGAAWRIAPVAEVAASGGQISLPGYPARAWVPAQVPGTVFGSYVNDGLEKEPTYGDNIYRVDRAKYDRDFWYRTEFTAPAVAPREHLWLNFDGVNRDADVYVNGTQLGGMRGFMQRGRFDITGLVHAEGRNALAVRDHLPVGGANGSSPSFICSEGWDWMPYVPGRNMGIYKDVYLTRTGPVSLRDPWVRTALPSRAEADLSVQVTLENDAAAPASGVLAGVICPGAVTFSRPVTLGPGETRVVTLDAHSVPALRLKNPRLWWPNGYGAPNLYSCRLAFRAGLAISDAQTVRFGVRQYTYDTDGGILHFHVNGVRVFPKGGNWGMAEFMLRCHGKDYDTRLRFHREMHFNMIRNWMGMTADEAFYDACDRYGMMVWDEFWLNSGGSLPADVNVYRANVIEKIKQVRNHPCVALWCGENEGDPAPPLNDWLRADVRTYDGGDRRYQPNSHAGDLSGSGPWNDLPIRHYFRGVPTWGNLGDYGMRSEVGTATVTSFESLRRFMPRADWWPRDAMWNLHFLGPSAGNAGPDGYNADIDGRYGEAGGIEDYCRKAQLLNLETMKAIFEGWLDHSDRDASGVLIWMSQSAYPSFVWQTYDYYYDLTGAYWGARAACEPVHIYWNADDDHIRVVNSSRTSYRGLTAEAWIYNLDGSRRSHAAGRVSSRPGAVTDCFTLHYPPGLSPTHFLKLRLRDDVCRV
ncbi:MAG: beta-mannosidase, partial [Armatimonadetes bacterium]|nr:beta-mannosidase [Armatimonadota bacterium]